MNLAAFPQAADSGDVYINMASRPRVAGMDRLRYTPISLSSGGRDTTSAATPPWRGFLEELMLPWEESPEHEVA